MRNTPSLKHHWEDILARRRALSAVSSKRSWRDGILLKRHGKTHSLVMHRESECTIHVDETLAIEHPANTESAQYTMGVARSDRDLNFSKCSCTSYLAGDCGAD